MREQFVLSLTLPFFSLFTPDITSGQSWLIQQSNTTEWLNGVHFTDPSKGVIVGNAGAVLHTTNGGATWTIQSSGVTQNLNEVFFPSPNVGWAVGDDGTIIKSTDGGITWTGQVSSTTEDLIGVSFTDMSTGTIVGTAFGGSGTILRTTNGGSSWIAQSSGTTNHLRGVSFLSGEYGFVVGDLGIALHTTNAGATWTTQSSSTFERLHFVSFADSMRGLATGENGTIIRTTNGGLSWTTQISSTSQHLNAISFPDSNTGFAVGDAGIILRSTDGGQTWASQSSGTPSILIGVHFINSGIGATVGRDGVILHTSSLVAYYPFIGNAYDESGNGNDGMVSGATLTIDRFGNPANAYQFNGVNNSIQVPHSSSFEFTATQQFTFVGWIKINSYQHQAIVFKGAANTPPGYFNEWTVVIEPDSTLRFKVNADPTNTSYSYLQSNPSVDLYEWSQVAAIWDGKTNVMKLYLNEVEVGSLSNAISQIVSMPDQPLYLGFVGDGPLNGTLDDIRIYNRVLSETEIDSLYFEGGLATTRYYSVAASWNILSVPLTVNNLSVATVFPSAISPAYTFDPLSGYVEQDTLHNGIGYWLKFPDSQNVSISGFLRTRDTIDVAPGWNMIGSISNPVDTSDVQQLPPGILASPFYEYSGTYTVADTLWPARGYRVKTSGPGSIILSAPVATQARKNR